MSIKADSWIRRLAEAQGMIEPFSADQVSSGRISYGLSSYGYDLRLATEFKIFVPPAGALIDPKAIPTAFYRDHQGDHCDIPGNTYALGRTVEYLRIPRDVLTLCVGKSTYARAGILVNVTPFEPEWEGGWIKAIPVIPHLTYDLPAPFLAPARRAVLACHRPFLIRVRTGFIPS